MEVPPRSCSWAWRSSAMDLLRSWSCELGLQSCMVLEKLLGLSRGLVMCPLVACCSSMVSMTRVSSSITCSMRCSSSSSPSFSRPSQSEVCCGLGRMALMSMLRVSSAFFTFRSCSSRSRFCFSSRSSSKVRRLQPEQAGSLGSTGWASTCGFRWSMVRLFPDRSLLSMNEVYFLSLRSQFFWLLLLASVCCWFCCLAGVVWSCSLCLSAFSLCCLQRSMLRTSFLQMQREQSRVSPSLSRRSSEMRLLFFLSMRASSFTPSTRMSFLRRLRHLVQPSSRRKATSSVTALSLRRLPSRLTSHSPMLEMSSAGVSPRRLYSQISSLRRRACSDSTFPTMLPTSHSSFCDRSRLISDSFSASPTFSPSSCSSVSPHRVTDSSRRLFVFRRLSASSFRHRVGSGVRSSFSTRMQGFSSRACPTQRRKSLNLGWSTKVLGRGCCGFLGEVWEESGVKKWREWRGRARRRGRRGRSSGRKRARSRRRALSRMAAARQALGSVFSVSLHFSLNCCARALRCGFPLPSFIIIISPTQPQMLPPRPCIIYSMNLEDTESSVSEAQINLRNKGLRTAGGRVHKGCVKDAFTKLSIGSIPSNYESIIYHHEEKRGFGTSQKRFFPDARPDPQDPPHPDPPHPVPNVSHSSKGYGPLIAREKREWLPVAQSPGPGRSFTFEQLLRSQKMKRKCYTRERENFKRSEILVSKENTPTPGPGQYELEQVEDPAGCKSSFVTRDNREGYIPRSGTPGPGCYTADAGSRQERVEKREPLDQEIFAKMWQQEKRVKSKLFLARKKHEGPPGPGHYDYDMPNFKPLYQRIKISSNFMQTGKDRFNAPLDAVKEEPAGPTPCSYELPSAFDPREKLIDMSCFMSESKREAFAGVERRLGPNVRWEGREGKKNYHFNIRGEWL